MASGNADERPPSDRYPVAGSGAPPPSGERSKTGRLKPANPSGPQAAVRSASASGPRAVVRPGAAPPAAAAHASPAPSPPPASVYGAPPPPSAYGRATPPPPPASAHGRATPPPPASAHGSPSPGSSTSTSTPGDAYRSEAEPTPERHPSEEPTGRRRALPRLQCKKCGIVYSGALPKAQRCLECESPLVEADPTPAPTPRPAATANDTAPPSRGALGSPLLWAPGSSKRSELLVTRYLIRDPTTDILGSGAKGVVYRAEDRRMGNRPVAIKLFFDDSADDLEAARDQHRTEREIRIQALLTHPAIVTAHDRFESPHGSGIVLEYIDGESLEERVRKKGPLAVREAARVAVEIAKAVEFMHGQGVIHRDLKPANILLTRDGNVKVIDFGVAKQKEERSEKDKLRIKPIDSDEVGITREGSIVGTPSYMSPEQALGRVAFVDERADVYGVGAILYFAVTGKPPFLGDDVEAILDRVRKLPPPPPSTWNDRVDKPMEAIIEKSLRKLPEHRFQNAGAMAEQLRRYLDGERLDTSVYLEPLARRAARSVLEHPAASVGVIAAICAVFLVLAAIHEYGQYRDGQNLEEELAKAAEKLRKLDVQTAISRYSDVLQSHPGNEKAIWGLQAATKALVHVDLYTRGKTALDDARKTAERGDDAEALYDHAYHLLWDARAHGSPATDLDELLKKAQGVARLDVQSPINCDGPARLTLHQLSDDDLSEARLALDAKLPIKAQELPTGLYQAAIEGKGLVEPLLFPIKISRGADVSVEAVPSPWPEMVYVRGHPHFRSGHPRHDDNPALAVEPFFIDRCEVTVGDYQQFLESIKDPVLKKRRTPAHWSELTTPEPADWPVTNIAFDDAQAFAAFKGKDLPTEAQWQLAAAGGLDDRDYPYGRRYVAVYSKNTGNKPEAVGSHRHDRSPFGAYDMGGNVSELVKGFFDPEGTLRLAKGGSFAKRAPVWERLPVAGPDRTIGFRCARPLH